MLHPYLGIWQDIMRITIHPIDSSYKRSTPTTAVSRSKRSRQRFSDPNHQEKEHRGSGKKITLLPFDMIKYRKRVGAKLKPNEKFALAPSYQTKYGNFANAFLIEARYQAEISHQYQWISATHPHLPTLLNHETSVREESIASDLVFHKKRVIGLSLTEICDLYSIDEVIGYDLFNLNIELEDAVLQYKAFEILGKEYGHELSLHHQSLIRAKDEKAKASARITLESVKKELNLEFISFLYS